MTNKIKIIQTISELEEAERHYASGLINSNEYHDIAEAVNFQWRYMGLNEKEREYALGLLADSKRRINKFLDELWTLKEK